VSAVSELVTAVGRGAVADRDAQAGHVLASDVVLDPVTERLAALIDPAFLAEVGWDQSGWVLSLPSQHPLLGWTACATPGCASGAYGREQLCGVCRAGGRRPVIEPVMGSGGPAPARRGQLCAVAACDRSRGTRRYCRAHYERLLGRRRTDPAFDEARWCRLEPALERAGQVSLHAVPAPAVVRVLYGLQQRTRDGAKTGVAELRQVAVELRALQPAGLEQVGAGSLRDQHKLVRCFARHVERAFLQPETERVKDTWNLVAFGLTGNLSFTRISQPWLRETAKRWAADDLPKRRGKAAAGPVRHYLTGVAALSDSLRAARPDHGEDPRVLGRADIDSFLHRLAFLTGDGRLSTDARIRICREIKHLLGRFRALGLTRAGGPAAGLGEDFALARSDVPRQCEDPEANRDLPTEIMRQLCEHLPVLEQEISSREVRVAVELLIDTGRRPDEVCSLAWDCLEYDEPDHAPVLVYDNHKNARPGRRLPIGQTTADLITGQKDRVRARFPATELTQLKLLPAAHANPHGGRCIGENQLGERHRTWIDALPVLLRGDGSQYDKTRIVPYAYRHTYAQRHADAGVPIDVLATLMDHRSFNTTRHYYRVGDVRRREAVERVTALQFDRHGNRIWRTAQALLDSQHARHIIGTVAVPFGTCAEPSNVQAGGHACPYRFRCAGCDHFRTDISYLPDLHAYLDDLLRTRERLLAAASTDIDDWARAEATPSDEEITRIRRLIARISAGLDELTAPEREQVQQAVTLVRRHRTVMLAAPRLRPALLEPIHPERPA